MILDRVQHQNDLFLKQTRHTSSLRVIYMFSPYTINRFSRRQVTRVTNTVNRGVHFDET